MHTKVKNCNSAYKSSCERFANWNNDYILLIKHTPSAAGQKSHFFITKKSWKKSSMSPEFDTWNQRFGTFVDDLWWNFWFWSGGPPQRNGPKFLAKFPCKMAQNWGFLTSEPSRYIKMQIFLQIPPEPKNIVKTKALEKKLAPLLKKWQRYGQFKFSPPPRTLSAMKQYV